MLMKSLTNTAVIRVYIEMGDLNINCKKDIKLLGITIDDKLTLINKLILM